MVEWRRSNVHAGYLVSSEGNIVGPRHKVLCTRPNSNGYPMVKLGNGKTISVHRMVADAFFGPISPQMTVNHKDGNKTNNAVSNLEIISRSANVKHAFDTGLKQCWSKGKRRPDCTGSRNFRAKLTEADVIAIVRRRKSGERAKDVAAAYGVTPSIVSNITAGRIWRHVTDDVLNEKA